MGRYSLNGTNPSVLRTVSSEDLVYSMVTMANNMLLYTWELLRTNLKDSHHKKRDLTVWADGYVNFLEPGNPSTVYMYVKSSHYTLNIYDYICQLFLNKAGGKTQMRLLLRKLRSANLLLFFSKESHYWTYTLSSCVLYD